MSYSIHDEMRFIRSHLNRIRELASDLPAGNEVATRIFSHVLEIDNITERVEKEEAVPPGIPQEIAVAEFNARHIQTHMQESPGTEDLSWKLLAEATQNILTALQKLRERQAASLSKEEWEFLHGLLDETMDMAISDMHTSLEREEAAISQAKYMVKVGELLVKVRKLAK